MSSNILENTMAEMTWLRVKEYAEENATVLLPIGVIEEHGPHLCLGTDIYLATAMSTKICEVMEKESCKALVAPPFYWGIVSCVNAHFPGTFTAREETVKLLIYDIISSLKNSGFKNVIGLNYHGDRKHCRVIREAFKESSEQLNMNVYWQTFNEELQREGLTGNERYILSIPFPPLPENFVMDSYLDIHAGANETQFMLEEFPNLVNTKLADSLKPTSLSNEELHSWMNGDIEDKELTPDGYLGNPAGYKNYPINNEEFIKYMAYEIVKFVNKQE